MDDGVTGARVGADDGDGRVGGDAAPRRAEAKERWRRQSAGRVGKAVREKTDADVEGAEFWLSGTHAVKKRKGQGDVTTHERLLILHGLLSKGLLSKWVIQCTFDG